MPTAGWTGIYRRTQSCSLADVRGEHLSCAAHLEQARPYVAVHLD